jgi:hypothetical protein
MPRNFLRDLGYMIASRAKNPITTNTIIDSDSSGEAVDIT